MTGIVRNQHIAYRNGNLIVRASFLEQDGIRLAVNKDQRVYRGGRLAFTTFTPQIPFVGDQRNYKFLRRRRRI